MVEYLSISYSSIWKRSGVFFVHVQMEFFSDPINHQIASALVSRTTTAVVVCDNDFLEQMLLAFVTSPDIFASLRVTRILERPPLHCYFFKLVHGSSSSSQNQIIPRRGLHKCAAFKMQVSRRVGIDIRSSSIRHKPLVIRYFLLLLAAALLASHAPCFVTSSNRVGPELQVEDPSRVNVYIYDDPVFDETSVIRCYRDHNHGVAPWLDEREGMAQDAGEIWLHQSLLSHPWRVLDPEDADVFFIPIYPVLNAKVQKQLKECDGLSKQQRATRSIMHLVTNSPYFNRFGGADHVVVCAWWNCGRGALDRQHRMLLRRAVVGINEAINIWSLWGCGEKMVTVPYTPSSGVTTTSIDGGRTAEERTIPFFFVGTARGRPERENLKVSNISEYENVQTRQAIASEVDREYRTHSYLPPFHAELCGFSRLFVFVSVPLVSSLFSLLLSFSLL